MKKIFGFLLFAEMAFGVSFARATPAGPEEMPYWAQTDNAETAAESYHKVQHWTQTDGTEVLLVEDHRAPVITIKIRFPGGTWSPWARRMQAGLAFQMQTYDRKGELTRLSTEGALLVYATVRALENELVVQCLRSSLPQAVRYLQSLWKNNNWNESSLSTRRLSQPWIWKNQQDEPDFRLQQTMHQAFYQPGDSRRTFWEPPLEPPSVLTPLLEARDAQVSFLKRRVGWSGDIDRATVEAAMVALLPAVKQETPIDLQPSYKPLQSPGNEQRVFVSKTQQAYLAYARSGLGVEDPRFPALSLAHHVWGGHFYSRLYKALRGEQGTTYEINTSLASTIEPDLYYIITYTGMSKIAEIENKLQGALQLFFTQGIQPTEFKDAKSYLLHHAIFEEQTPNQILETALSERARGLPLGFTVQLRQRIQKVTLEEVNQLIREFYDPTTFHKFWVLSQ